MAVKKKAGNHRAKRPKPKQSIKRTPKKAKSTVKASEKELKVNESRLSVYISLAVIGAVILAFGGFYGYRTYRQGTVDAYNGSVYEIQISTQQKLSKLDPFFQEFVAAPSYAKVLAPKFKEASSVTGRTALALKTLSPPGQHADEHKKLVEMYKKASDLYEDLYLLSDYIKEREGAIKSLISQLKSFSKQMSESDRRVEAMAAAKKAEQKIKKVLTELKELKSPIAVYDDKVLVDYTSALTKHLKEFHEATEANSTYQTQSAIYNIQVDFSQNWQGAFFSADKKAVSEYDQRVKQIQALYSEITS